MFNKISRLDRLSLWGAGVKAGLAAMAAAVMFSTLSPATAQQPTEAPPAAEAPAAAPVDPTAAAPEAAAAEEPAAAEEAAPVELTVDKGDTAFLEFEKWWGGFFLIGTARERERASIWHPWVGEHRFLERAQFLVGADG